MGNDNKNQPCSSRTTRNLCKKAPSVNLVPLERIFRNPNDHLPFIKVTGPVRNTPQGQKALPYFKLFHTNKIIDIGLESNRYQNQIELQKSSMITQKPIVKDFSIYWSHAMGIGKLPEIQDYWKSKGIFLMPWLTSLMLQNHFEEIYQYLHLAKQATGDLHNFNISHKLRVLPHELSLRFSAM